MSGTAGEVIRCKGILDFAFFPFSDRIDFLIHMKYWVIFLSFVVLFFCFRFYFFLFIFLALVGEMTLLLMIRTM